MKKGIIFDFDGVIIDSFKVQEKALRQSYKLIVGEGEPSVDEFFSLSGDSLENIFKQMNLPLAMVEPYKKISSENMDDILVFEGIVEMLKKLKKLDYKVGLCTGKNRERTIEILEYLDLKKYFDSIVCSDDVKKSKPAPDSLLYVIEQLGLTSEETIMVGDAPNDIKCAKNAKVTSIAASWGVMKQDLIEAEKPDCIVYSVENFVETVEDLNRREIIC